MAQDISYSRRLLFYFFIALNSTNQQTSADVEQISCGTNKYFPIFCEALSRNTVQLLVSCEVLIVSTRLPRTPLPRVGVGGDGGQKATKCGAGWDLFKTGWDGGLQIAGNHPVANHLSLPCKIVWRHIFGQHISCAPLWDFYGVAFMCFSISVCSCIIALDTPELRGSAMYQMHWHTSALALCCFL